MTDIATGRNRRNKAAATDQDHLEKYRVELTAYCYRMLGSAFEAEDAVQETMLRAWRGLEKFDGRSSLRTWLYRIATNICIDMLKGRQRRALPIDLGPSSRADDTLAEPLPEATWVEPIPDGRVIPIGGDPAEQVELRDSVRLAFVTALQHLPPKQRTVLILREVLRWSAIEVAGLLETSVASVNSALQRARATLETKEQQSVRPAEQIGKDEKDLLARYVDAFERYDIDSFVSLLHEDATQAMPPYPMWLVGPEEIARWMLGAGIGCKGSRLVPLEANGAPAFAQYRPSPDGGYEAFSIHVPEFSEGRICRANYFLDTKLFSLFGLPERLDA
jgi:RNA polymerase sigma-70 factor (ECF subfamily)